MKRVIYAVLIVIVSATFAGCRKTDIGEPLLTPDKIFLSAAASQAIAGSNEFGIELFVRVAGNPSAE